MNIVDLVRPEVRKLAPDVPVVFAVATLEQHGHSLPVCTDSLPLGAIITRVSRAPADRFLVAPLQWPDNSHHDTNFVVTLSAAARPCLDMLGDLVDCFAANVSPLFERVVAWDGRSWDS